MKKYVAEVVSVPIHYGTPRSTNDAAQASADLLALRREYVGHLNGEDSVAGRLRPEGGVLVSTTPLCIDGVTSALLVTWEVDVLNDSASATQANAVDAR